MKTIAIANQKGGIGKTTTTHNLGAGLRRAGYNVLLIDLDPQGSLTRSCGVDAESLDVTSAHWLHGDANAKFSDIGLHVESSGVDLIPGSQALATAEIQLVSKMGADHRLKKLFKQLPEYDVVLIDCPPSLGKLTINALSAAQHVLIPVQTEFHALTGLENMLDTIQLAKETINEKLKIIGVLATLHRKKVVLNREALKVVRETVADKLLENPIHQDVRLAEAPSHGRDIFDYAPSCRGAVDYGLLTKEIIGRLL